MNIYLLIVYLYLISNQLQTVGIILINSFKILDELSFISNNNFSVHIIDALMIC